MGFFPMPNMWYSSHLGRGVGDYTLIFTVMMNSGWLGYPYMLQSVHTGLNAYIHIDIYTAFKTQTTENRLLIEQ